MTDEQAREAAQEILSRPEYAAHRQPSTALQDLVEAIAAWLRGLADYVPQWLVDLWDGFWSGVGDALGFAFGDDAVVVLLRLTLAVLVLGAFGMGLARVLRALRAREGEAEVAHERADGAGGPEWMADAEAFARGGRFVDAAHCAQLASLELLLRKRWLELERSDPNRTLRRRLGEAQLPAAIRDRFLSLLDRLEGSWFRDRVADRELYSDWRDLHTAISALPEGR